MIDIQTTQKQIPGLYGAVVSFFSPGIYSVIISLIWPGRFDWREFLRIDLIEDESQSNSSTTSGLPSTEAVDEAAKTTEKTKMEAYSTIYKEAGPQSIPLS